MDTPLEAPLPAIPVSPPVLSPPRPSLLRLIHDRNPFFLLSAVSMFVGFRIVIAAANTEPGDLKHLLCLILTLNVYEALLIALGLFLIVRRSALRDGWILLTIEALFLVDLTNLNAEFFGASTRLGLIVCGITLILAIVKIFLITHTLNLRLTLGTKLFILIQLAVLFALPGLFKAMTHHANITSMQDYVIWWLVGLLIVVGAFLVRRASAHTFSPVPALPWRLYVLVPLISLIVHLAGQNRVYDMHFNVANVTPVLLALVIVLNRARFALRLATLGWSIALIVLAIILSAIPPENSAELHRHIAKISIAPWRLSLLASAAVLLYVAMIQHSWIALTLSVAIAFTASVGVDIPNLIDNATRFWNRTQDASRHIVPETPLQWGYTAIAGAFLLLGLGALISLCKRQEMEVQPAKLE
jgi:hypothetical protein